jgi:hypothetical protein
MGLLHIGLVKENKLFIHICYVQVLIFCTNKKLLTFPWKIVMVLKLLLNLQHKIL